ncbi:MAG: GGDEF domain-containing response regulator [Polyangiales bacterium]
MMVSRDPRFGSGLSALVVDDEPVIRQLLQVVLHDLGFRVETLPDLRSARERTTVHDFDLVLVDKNLPDGSGLELCQALREADIDCKFVVMSGYANLTSAVEAFQLSVADYFVKPLDLDDLHVRLGKVVELLSLSRKNRKLVEELTAKNIELEALSVRDPLTRLFNHGHLQEVLQQEIARSQRHQRAFTIALLNIDGFRAINEGHGHIEGDRILREVADLIQKRSRKSDVSFRVAEQLVAARYGGDVFALILPETDRASAALKLGSLRDSIRAQDYGLGEVPLTTSAGFACYPDDAQEREGLLEAAGRALNACKRAGGDQLIGYTTELGAMEQAGAAQTAARAKALSRSLTHGAFRFVYQPIVRVRDNSLFAYEALCRPTDNGFRHVGELFETAVRTGRIRELGRALRRIVIEPMNRLPEEVALFVNLHPQDLGDDQKLEAEAHLMPWARRIVLEVTETEAIKDYERARSRIKTLRECGFRVALDDLGSGYSSLNLLAQLEPDFVKLDMELVRGVRAAGRTARLVQHLVEFCRGEGFVTVAEGIETREELASVSELGVDLVQGYLLARPEPPFVPWPNTAPPAQP